MDKEIRSFQDSEFRIIPESRTIEGYALNFNVKSADLGGFREVILPSAINGVIELSDVLATYQHNEDQILARSTFGKGTLSLNVDNNGLKYSFEAPKTTLGDTLIESIKRGDIRNSSFAFSVASDGQEWEKRDDGTFLRTITKFERLYDVACVARPAYQSTTVALRSLEQKLNEERTKVEITIELKDEDTMEPEMDPTNIIPMMEPEKDFIPNPVEELAVPEEEPVSSEEQIEIICEGETFSIPKSLIQDYIDKTKSSRKLELYFSQLEESIVQLKK